MTFVKKNKEKVGTVVDLDSAKFSKKGGAAPAVEETDEEAAPKAAKKSSKVAKAAKPQKETKQAKTSKPSSSKDGKLTVAKYMRELIAEGKKTDDAIFKACQQKFKDLDDNKRWYVAWYRNDMKKKGLNPPAALAK